MVFVFYWLNIISHCCSYKMSYNNTCSIICNGGSNETEFGRVYRHCLF